MDAAQTADKFVLRMPDGMRDRIKVAAGENKRSSTAEIIARLEASFDTPASLSPAIASLIEQHVQSEVDRRLVEAVAVIAGGR